MQPSTSTHNGGGVDGETAIGKCRQNIAGWRLWQDRVVHEMREVLVRWTSDLTVGEFEAAGMWSEPEMFGT